MVNRIVLIQRVGKAPEKDRFPSHQRRAPDDRYSDSQNKGRDAVKVVPRYFQWPGYLGSESLPATK